MKGNDNFLHLLQNISATCISRIILSWSSIIDSCILLSSLNNFDNDGDNNDNGDDDNDNDKGGEFE